MNNSSTSCAAGAGPPRDLCYPIDSTHIDIGCVACGAFIQLCSNTSRLRGRIGEHKSKSPSCFNGSKIDDTCTFADCARAVEELARSNVSLFERNAAGDTDSFFTRDLISGFQCSRCLKCFENKGQACRHVSGDRTQCRGCDVSEIACRKTIFGTLCPAPLACTRRRVDLEATADACTTVRTPAQSRRSASITPGTATPMIAAAASAPHSPVPFPPAPTIRPTVPACNPYSSVAHFERALSSSQLTDPSVLRALKLIQDPSFPFAESEWQKATRMMEPFLLLGMDADDIAHMYFDLGSPPCIVTALTSTREHSDQNESPSFDIDILVAAVKEYFLNLAKKDVKRLWPNIRALIQTTSASTDEDENTYNGCFNFRRSAEGLIKLATSLIVYLWRSPSFLHCGLSGVLQLAKLKYAGDITSAAALVAGSCVIAEILLDVLLEPPSSADSASTISVWATANCFWYHKGKKEYRLSSPGGCSKMLAALHNLLRVGACTVIAKSEKGPNFQAEATDLAKKIREAPVQSWLGGAIRTWRDVGGRISSKDPPATVRGGDIWIGDQKLSRKIIRQLIPTVTRRILDVFGTIISGTEWKDIINPENEIMFHRTADGSISFDILYPNGNKKSSKEYFRNSLNDLELNANLIKVAGYIYLCFHGFGGGSPRGQELYRTARYDVVVSGGMMFYETISKKTKSKYIKTKRCLPPCISRLVMMSFVMYSGGDDGQLFNLNFDQVDEAVASTYGDVFGLTHRLSFQKSRQLFASVGNTMKKMYPDRNFDTPGIVSVYCFVCRS